jgi:hypothetical protein
MTSKQITTLIKKTVANALTDFFNDPDFGKTVRSSFLKSLEKARNDKGRSVTLKQFRKQYGF